MNRSRFYAGLFHTFFIFGLLLCVSGCSGSGGGGGGGGVAILSGTVFTISYEAISNADVVVDSVSTKSLSNGTYSFVNIPSGDKSISIASAVHTPAYRKVTLSGGTSVNAGVAFLADLDSKVTFITSVATETASNTSGSIKMVFPINAFSISPTKIILTKVPKIAAPFNPPEGEQFISYIVYAKVDPITSILQSPAKLYIPNLTSITVEGVPFYRFDTDPNVLSWTLFDYGTNESPSNPSNPISVNITNTGWFAAIMSINPAPGTITGIITDQNTSLPILGANVWTDTSYAVSDSNGKYTLEFVPTGITTVEVSALGFIPSFGSVNVESLKTKTLDIPLTPQSQGNISGTVRSDDAGSPIANARVVASGRLGETYTDDYGRYTLYNLPKVTTIRIDAFATGFISSYEVATIESAEESKSGVDFILPETGTLEEYSFDLTTGTNEGFSTTEGVLWHIQDSTATVENYFNSSHEGGAVTRKVRLPDAGEIPNVRIGGDGQYYFWYGQASPPTVEGSYIGQQSNGDVITTAEFTGGSTNANFSKIGTLESPEISLSGYIYGKLSFWTWWEVEGKNPAVDSNGIGYDQMGVYVAATPYTTWDRLDFLNPYEDPDKSIPQSGEAYTSGGFNLPGVWVQHNFDLSPYAGKIIKVRFVFNTYDFGWNGYRGWFIDDISITNSQMGIFSIIPKRQRHEIIREPRN